MKVLILGGAGFIGSHLCDFMLDKGNSVICIDNFVTGSIDNVKHNLKNIKFKLIEQDITCPIEISGKIDWVLNFASPASPKDYEKLPIETLKVGSIGTLNALEIARAQKAGFLLASTSEVYGDPSVSPQKETYWGNVNPVGLRSCYDEAKRFSEALTMAYYRKYNIDVRIARIFNTYGPRMRKADGRVIPNFINQVLAGRPLTIYGQGKQTRSFCYVDDLVKGIYELMNYHSLSDNLQPRIFNLGNPNEFTIMALAKVISCICGKRIKVRFKPLPQDDPRRRKPNISLARKALAWEPRINLEDGLRQTIAWYRENNC